jgi:hypothetical protein
LKVNCPTPGDARQANESMIASSAGRLHDRTIGPARPYILYRLYRDGNMISRPCADTRHGRECNRALARCQCPLRALLRISRLGHRPMMALGAYSSPAGAGATSAHSAVSNLRRHSGLNRSLSKPSFSYGAPWAKANNWK